MSIWSAGVGGMQAERQLKDDLFKHHGGGHLHNHQHHQHQQQDPHLYKLGAKEAKFGTSPLYSSRAVLPGPTLPLIRVICIEEVVVADLP